MKSSQPKFQLILQAASGDSRPPAIRLRRALKLLLRACGLRCIGCIEVKPDAEPTAKKSRRHVAGQP